MSCYLSSLLDYIELLHDSGKYEKQTAKIIPFCRFIDAYENAVSAGTGIFLVDGPKETIQLTKDVIPENASYGVKISGDSMEPEFEDGQIAWVLKQDFVKNGELGIFSLNGEAYIKKLQDDKNWVFLVSLNEKYEGRCLLWRSLITLKKSVSKNPSAEKADTYARLLHKNFLVSFFNYLFDEFRFILCFFAVIMNPAPERIDSINSHATGVSSPVFGTSSIRLLFPSSEVSALIVKVVLAVPSVQRISNVCVPTERIFR